MAFKLNHLHIKTPDPEKTAQYYVAHLGATVIDEIEGRGLCLDLHGLTVNMTTFVEDQAREQAYGIEHIAIEADDVSGVAEELKANWCPNIGEDGLGKR